MTLIEAAEIIDNCKTSYQLKESGKREFKLSEAQRLAEYFGITVDKLFEK